MPALKRQAEIREFKSIKQDEFGTSETPIRMDTEGMGLMGTTDPQELARQDPFDKAFIDAMIAHHESAVAMAEVSLEESESPEIRKIAQDIVGAQKRESSQMKEWRREWYPEG